MDSPITLATFHMMDEMQEIPSNMSAVVVKLWFNNLNITLNDQSQHIFPQAGRGQHMS